MLILEIRERKFADYRDQRESGNRRWRNSYHRNEKEKLFILERENSQIMEIRERENGNRRWRKFADHRDKG